MHLPIRVWSHLRFRVALHARLAVDVSGAIAGLALLLAGGHSVTDAIGWALTGLSSALLLHDLREKWRRQLHTQIAENDDYGQQIGAVAFDDGYRLHCDGLIPGADPALLGVKATRPYLTSETVNRLLDGADNPLVLRPDAYRVPEMLMDYRERCIACHQPDFNAPKVRLCTDLTEGILTRGAGLDVQRTDYFSGAATNEMACDQFERTQDAAHGRPGLLFAVSDMVIIGGHFVGLADSVLSNHVGVTTMVLTADDRIAIQAQGRQMISANETGIGASGSVDLADLRVGAGAPSTLQAMLRRAMQREASEELSAAFASERATRLTGYARYLARGGKPEFFGISRSASPAAALKATRADARYVSGIWGQSFEPTVSGLVLAIEDLLAEGTSRRRRYSLSMVVCLRLAKAWLADQGAGALPL